MLRPKPTLFSSSEAIQVSRRATVWPCGTWPQGTRLLRLAWTLAWLDIRLRYRGSMLGPLWLTLSTGIMVGALGYLYAGIFHIDVHDYLPFLALSLVLWGFLGSVVSESCTAFTESEGIVRAVRMPFFLFAIRLLIRNVLVLAHNVLVIVVVFVVFRVWPGWYRVAGDSRTAALGDRCARACPAVGNILRAVPRHPADRDQRDADRLLRDAR